MLKQKGKQTNKKQSHGNWGLETRSHCHLLLLKDKSAFLQDLQSFVIVGRFRQRREGRLGSDPGDSEDGFVHPRVHPRHARVDDVARLPLEGHV